MSPSDSAQSAQSAQRDQSGRPAGLAVPVILFDGDRESDSPYIERVWYCHSEQGGSFTSVASSHWELVVTRLEGDTTVTLRGPETRPRQVQCPANGEWFAIRFKAGTFMPRLPVG